MNSTSLFDWLHMMAGNIWLYGGAFFLVLGVLVFVHEWGHFIVARLCGVKIDSFSIGFGPEVFGYTARSGTRWKFSAIPLGGYVKMFGNTDVASAGDSDQITEGETTRPMTAEERKTAFFSQPVGHRALIVFAGPAINFIFRHCRVNRPVHGFTASPLPPPLQAPSSRAAPPKSAGFLPHDAKCSPLMAMPSAALKTSSARSWSASTRQRDFTVLRGG